MAIVRFGDGMTVMARSRDALTRRGRRRVALAVLGVVVPGGVASADVSYVPAQIRTVYGVNSLGLNSLNQSITGAGTTIAIVDAENDATALSDANTFSSMYNISLGSATKLPQFNVTGGPTLTVINQSGGSTPPTQAANTTDRSLYETSLDIQWAHAIAPMANIVLVQAANLSSGNLAAAVRTAKTYANVSTVSMSFGSGEFPEETGTALQFDQSTFLNENTFTQTAGHGGVSFLAATGDSGTVSYPAASPSVIAVGATSLTLNASSGRTSETVWNDKDGSTGSGFSAYFNRSSPQSAVLPATANRAVPDVAWNGDPATGYNIEAGGLLLSGAGGTSISCPQWAGVIALADQTRTANGLDTLTSTQTLNMLYALYGTPYYSQAFYDVTSGTANGYSATTGFDETTGLGTPNVNFLVPYLDGDFVIPTPEPTSLALLALVATPVLGCRRKRFPVART